MLGDEGQAVTHVRIDCSICLIDRRELQYRVLPMLMACLVSTKCGGREQRCNSAELDVEILRDFERIRNALPYSPIAGCGFGSLSARPNLFVLMAWMTGEVCLENDPGDAGWCFDGGLSPGKRRAAIKVYAIRKHMI
jgi:hypothetical protein